jgi:hypothetical protein
MAGRFDGRVGGENVARFGGMDLESDPGAIPRHKFREIINARFQGGRMVSRGGQSLLNDDALLGCIQGIFPPEFRFQDGVLPGLLMEGSSVDAGASQRGVWLGYNPGVGVYQIPNSVAQEGFGKVIISNVLYIGTVVSPENGGVFTLRVGDTEPVQLVGNISGGDGLSSVVKVGTDYFIGKGASGIVYKLTAAGVLTVDDTPGVAPGAPIMGVQGSEIVACYPQSHRARKRDGAGVWTELTMPGAGLDFRCHAVASFGGNLYFGGRHRTGAPGDESKGTIIKWDGATLTTVRGPLAKDTEVAVLYVFNGNLYYGYGHAEAYSYIDSTCIIGKFDGAVWTDVEKNLTTAFSVDSPKMLTGLAAYAGDLYALCERSPINSPWGHFGRLYKSPGTSTSGTWTKVASITAPTGFLWGNSAIRDGGNLFAVT